MFLFKNCCIVNPLKEVLINQDILFDEKIIKIEPEIKPLRDCKVIDMTGNYLAPLFFDSHSHDDLIITKTQSYYTKLRQGIGTLVLGNCGLSLFPLRKDDERFKKYFSPVLGRIPSDFECLSPEDYIEKIKTKSKYILLLGFNSLKSYFLNGRSRITNVELRQMKEYVASIAPYISGVSFGLSYYPANKSLFEELLEIAEVSKRLVFHIRSETFGFKKAIEEALRLGNMAEKPVHISHLKFINGNVKYFEEVIEFLDKNNVTFDLYPYNYGSTTIKALGSEKVNYADFKRILWSDDWDNIFKFVGAENIIVPKYNASLKELSIREATEELEILYKLVNSEEEISVIIKGQSREKMIELLFHKNSCIGTDGLPVSNPHPRLYNTISEYLKIGRNRGVGILELIRKITTLPASIFDDTQLGTIEKGGEASFVILNTNYEIDSVFVEGKKIKIFDKRNIS